MSRQPDVRVEHCLQHFQRVSTACEMMRDDQRHKTNCAGAGRADSVAKNPFKYQRDNHCAPADKNRRRIKIGDRRSLLQIHPRHQAERVDG